MPETVGALVISALATAGAGTVAAGASGATVGIVIGSTVVSASVIGSIFVAAGSIGLNYAVSAANQPKLKPSDSQQSIRQSIGPRIKHYGTVMAGGTFAFWDVRSVYWHQVIITGHGKRHSIVSQWFGDKKITIDGTANVTTYPWSTAATVRTNSGETSASFPELQAAYPSVWTTSHKLLGVTSAYLRFRNPGPKEMNARFGGGIPQYRELSQWQTPIDPRDGVAKFTELAGPIILDFLTSPDGYNKPMSKINLQSFIDFTNLCDEDVPLLSGATEKRYRLCGSYNLIAPHKNTLREILSACDAKVSLDRGGKITISGGRYESATCTLTEREITSIDTSFYADIEEQYTHIVGTFTSPSHNYQTVDSGAWIDTAQESQTSRRSTTLNLTWVPSHTQAQRLCKIAGMRLKARYRAALSTNLAGIDAWQQKTVRIIDTEMGVDTECEIKVQGFEIDGQTVSVKMSVVEISPDIWAWNPALDEQPAPPIPASTVVSTEIIAPQNVTLLVDPIQIDISTVGARIKVSWTPPGQQGLNARVEWRRLISPGVFDIWQDLSTEASVGVAVTSAVNNDGSVYEVRVQFVTFGGSGGPYSALQTIAISADNTPPDAPIIYSAIGASEQITVEYALPTSPNVRAVRIFRNSIDTLSGATLFGTFYGFPGEVQTVIVTGYAAGFGWVLIEAINGSGVASQTFASESAAVT